MSFLKKQEQITAINKLKEFLQDLEIQILPFSDQDYTVAAQAWGKFSKKEAMECPSCGAGNIFSCIKCKKQALWRNHILTNFLIGAHTQNNADCLLTRDRG